MPIGSASNRFEAEQGYTFDVKGNVFVVSEGSQFTFNVNRISKFAVGSSSTVAKDEPRSPIKPIAMSGRKFRCQRSY